MNISEKNCFGLKCWISVRKCWRKMFKFIHSCKSFFWCWEMNLDFNQYISFQSNSIWLSKIVNCGVCVSLVGCNSCPCKDWPIPNMVVRGKFFFQYSKSSNSFFPSSYEGKGYFIHSLLNRPYLLCEKLPYTSINVRTSKREELQQLLSLNDHKTGWRFH